MSKYFGLLFLFFLPVFAGATLPSVELVGEAPIGFVNDYASILTTEESASLEKKLDTFEKATTNEITIVIVESLKGAAIEDQAQEIFTTWGIGKQDKNNGVLLLISLSDRKTRIHTGYGVEGELTDIGTSYIQSDFITPAFREGKYYEGLNAAVDQMILALSGTEIVPENYENDGGGRWNIDFSFLFVIGFVVLQWIIAIFARSKSWWAGGVVGALISLGIWHFLALSAIIAVPMLLGLIGFGLFLDFLVSRSYHKYKDSGGHPPWFIGGGGLGGGGHSSGGFGGFGSGSSGGGGSSGSW